MILGVMHDGKNVSYGHLYIEMQSNCARKRLIAKLPCIIVLVSIENMCMHGCHASQTLLNDLILIFHDNI